MPIAIMGIIAMRPLVLPMSSMVELAMKIQIALVGPAAPIGMELENFVLRVLRPVFMTMDRA